MVGIFFPKEQDHSSGILLDPALFLQHMEMFAPNAFYQFEVDSLLEPLLEEKVLSAVICNAQSPLQSTVSGLNKNQILQQWYK